MEGQSSSVEQFRAGFVALIGDPNVGKSTLLNAVLRQKISIVTPKPQTTRHKILGILSTDRMQAVFLDTPGIIEPRYALHRAMMGQSASALDDADIIFFIVDLSRSDRQAQCDVLAKARDPQKPVYLVLNKVDCVSPEVIAEQQSAYTAIRSFRRSFAISALRGDGIPELLDALVVDLPMNPPYYPTDIASDRNDRFFVAEIIREKIFLLTRDEIPYSTSVEVVEFKEREAGKWFISADIVVERASQKGIVIGKGGVLLKEIGQRARADIERFLENPVFLDLHVKVRDKWREKEEWVKRYGYREDR